VEQKSQTKSLLWPAFEPLITRLPRTPTRTW